MFADRQLLVGHDLDSCTQSVEVVPCSLGDGEVIYLVDTPGFDDSDRSDTEILLEISAWLSKAHTEELKLAGIIYLHRISDVRVGGSGIANLKMFRRLCGDTNLNSVVLATTMWNDSEKETFEKREKMLMQDTDLWAPMIDHGSKVMRHDHGKVSGSAILQYLLNCKTRVTLDIQKELVDENKTLDATGAGHALITEMERLKKQYEARLAMLEMQLEEARKNWKDDKEAIEMRAKVLEQKLDQQREDKAKLQANYEEIVATEKKRCEQLLEEQEAKHAQDVGQKLQEEQKRLRAKWRAQQKQCIVM
ncbi:hypothetical protein E8E13_011138 [Curvularia kusanoi]|uniref:G domain-containing protein n=1 Tax=Curvularia kusanoi TaxID=90978 RepID=A0A9P4WDJ0_CURKU|nr:hypothetical protein E8E13_011138 [Curvularia kusanoi]